MRWIAPSEKCSAVFEHVYEAYRGEGASAFNDAA